MYENNRHVYFLGLILLMSLLQVGTIRKEEDPIKRTQTEPILFKQKMEEQKDGVKGAPTPSFNYYGKEKFLIEPPYEGENESEEISQPPSEDLEVDAEDEDMENGEDAEDSGDWWDWSDSEDSSGEDGQSEGREKGVKQGKESPG